MDNFFEGPCATCYGSSVKTESMRKAGELHSACTAFSSYFTKVVLLGKGTEKFMHGNSPSVLVRGVTKIITNTQRKFVQNGCTRLSITELGNPVKQEKEGTHEGLKNSPRASNRALNL